MTVASDTRARPFVFTFGNTNTNSTHNPYHFDAAVPRRLSPSFPYAASLEDASLPLDQVPELMNPETHWASAGQLTPKSVGRVTSHYRGSSLSSPGSAGPASPYTQTTSNPRIQSEDLKLINPAKSNPVLYATHRTKLTATVPSTYCKRCNFFSFAAHDQARLTLSKPNQKYSLIPQMQQSLVTLNLRHASVPTPQMDTGAVVGVTTGVPSLIIALIALWIGYKAFKQTRRGNPNREDEEQRIILQPRHPRNPNWQPNWQFHYYNPYPAPWYYTPGLPIQQW